LAKQGQRRKNLSFEERLVIEKMLKEGSSYSDIGRKLDRNRATISREVNINAHPYNAQDAQNGLNRLDKGKSISNICEKV